jgi:carboxyl-terminal processing protease
MCSKKTWIGSILCAFALLFVVVLSPSVFAQGKDGTVASDRYLQMLQYVYALVQEDYVDEVDPRILYEGAMKGMLDSLGDPYTTYVDSDSLLSTSLKDTTTGSFGGVGLSITKPVESTPDKPAWVEVASPIEDTPGWKAGVQPGDLILAIDGADTSELTMEQVLAKLRGSAGTNVTITLRRGKLLEFPVTLTRAKIELPTVKSTMMDGGIGYLRIIEFTPLTAQRVEDALVSFKAAGYTSLIIDLRNNPGGLITSVVDVADKFVESGVIVSTRGRIPYENRDYKASGSKPIVDRSIPIVVLINKGSASASEILSGALKDYHLAYLVGETSYGKGLVQDVLGLLKDDAMKITIARYYTPSGANIDKLGIPPDREVLFPELSEAEQKALTELLKTTKIADFVANKPNLTPTQAEAFAKTLHSTYPVDVRVLKKLVTQEYYRTRLSPMYDLEYDIQLKAAVDLLKAGAVPELLKSTKSVLELQEIAKKAKADAEAAAKAAAKQGAKTGAAGDNATVPADAQVPAPIE